MTRWKTAKDWSSTWGMHQPHSFKSEEEHWAQESPSECVALLTWSTERLENTTKKTNFAQPSTQTSSCPPGWLTWSRMLSLPVLILLVLHLWLGPMPVLWASTSNSLISYMSQPTGWSGHSSLPAILHTVQPRLIFNTEAKHEEGLKCENVRVCVWREGFMMPNNSHFSSASIAAPISACWMLD